MDSSTTGRPRERHEACFVMVNGRGYLLGGRGDNGVDIFNPKSRTWTRGPDMPTQMHHMQCVVYKSAIWIASSWYGPSPREKNNDKLWFLDTRSEKWQSRPGLPEKRRRGGAASVLYDEKIWVVGGNRGGHGPPSKTLSWMDYYDLKEKKWVTNLPELPEGRDHTGGGIVKGRLCVAGGRNGGAKSFFGAVITSTYCYDFARKKWENTRAPIPRGRAGSAYGTLCGGGLVVAGGEGKYSRAFDRVDVFDGSQWKELPGLQRERHGTGLAVANCNGCGHMFIASGSGARGGRPELDSTEVFLPNGNDATCDVY